MIRLIGVDRSFTEAKTGARVEAVQGFDLEVATGELVSLLGPSGSGKTTVLRMIAGFEAPDRGTVEVDGAPVAGVSPRRVLVAQDAALFPWLNVAENIAFGLRQAGMPAAESRDVVAGWVVRLGLRGAEGRLPRELSGGMRQRVALARALAVSPAVLLLDEPFAALDAISREQLQGVLEDAWRGDGGRRPTVVLVTHSVEEALRLSDRVIRVTARPARVAEIVAVDLPRPRDVAELAELRRRISAAMRAETAV